MSPTPDSPPRQPPVEPSLSAPRPPARERYTPFGNVAVRNDLQALLEVPILCRALRLPRGGRVLEIGCGRGIALPVLAARLHPARLVGIDVDPALVAIAEERVRAAGTAVVVLEADVRELPFGRGEFDLVVDFGTCYHVAGGVAGACRALAEISRVLCAGGLFVHETPVAQHLAHPVRSFGRSLPWEAAPALVSERTVLLWTARRKTRRLRRV